MYCKNCGKELADTAVFCVQCGATTEQKALGATVGNGTIVTGFVLAVFMPLIGIIIGIYTMAKGKVPQGIWMCVLAIFSAFFWFSVLLSNFD